MKDKRISKILIIGCSSGLGKELLGLYLDNHFQVYGVSRNLDELEKLFQGSLKSKKLTLLKADFELSAQELEASLSNLHGVTFDLVVNCIGGSCNIRAKLPSVSDMTVSLSKNLFTSLNLFHIINSGLIKSKKTVFVLSDVIKKYDGYTAYTVAKCATSALITILARNEQFDTKGTILSIAPAAMALPGRFLTRLRDSGGSEWENYKREHLKHGELLEPKDIFELLEYIRSSKTAHLHGVTIPLSEGYE